MVKTSALLHPIMCLTQDGLPQTHIEQAQALCTAGARLIQLRMKHVTPDHWLETARRVVAICRAHDALCIINDSVEIALASGAHGAHLSPRDGDWHRARTTLGPDKILGGTVNSMADATLATESGCLDYVGIGPWRFTMTKTRLAPILGPDGISSIIAQLSGIPAWAIGGIEPADLHEVRRCGAHGAAVSSYLYREGAVGKNYQALTSAWAQTSPLPHLNSPRS